MFEDFSDPSSLPRIGLCTRLGTFSSGTLVLPVTRDLIAACVRGTVLKTVN